MPQSAAKAIDLTTISGFAPQANANANVVPAAYAAGGPTPLPMRGTIR